MLLASTAALASQGSSVTATARPGRGPTSAGTAWMKKMRRDTVIAPTMPATATQARKNTVIWSATAGVGMAQAPQQARGQEAVVQALVRGQRRGLPRELRRVPERLQPERPRPEEHLEDEEPDVLDHHDEHDGGQGGLHGVAGRQ